MSACTHCDEPIQIPVFDEDPSTAFCCQGCLTVYQVLQHKGLGEYYDIKRGGAFLKRRSPVQLQSTQFEYLDDPAFLDSYTHTNHSGEREALFFLEGIHCLACLWLIEQLPEFCADVVRAKLDLEQSVLRVRLDPEGKLSRVALELSRLGYRPHPLKANQSTEKLKVREERWQLLRIGIAAAGASNIMLYAVSIYGGASGTYAEVFNLFTVLFALPVLTFSAWPFYRSALLAIRNRTMSIDVPISLALLCGGAMGVYSMVVGVHENYFDSLTTLVFLLLLSRYFLKKIQDQGLKAQDLHFFYQSESVRRLRDDAAETAQSVHPQFLKASDRILLSADEFVPVDGVVLRGEGKVNCALLTGESRAQALGPGASVFAGTQLVQGELMVRVAASGSDTRLGQILKTVESGWSQKAPIVELTQRISSYFLWTVCALAVLLFGATAATGSIAQALEAAITLLIVTCPCALALATPLTFTRALNLAARHGMVVKNDAVLERVSKVKKVFFDKTGTLTHGQLAITDMRELAAPMLPLADVVLSLEAQGKHPMARALSDWARAQGATVRTVTDWEEVPGVGVRGGIAGLQYRISRYEVWENDRLVATFAASDRLRREAPAVIDSFRRQGLALELLSGDAPDVAHAVASGAGLRASEVKAKLTPEEKSRILESATHAMMVGDGANDAIALTRADVGVAVWGATDISLRAADVYLLTPGLEALPTLLTLGTETMRVIRRNLIISLSYNVVSVLFVFAGAITPLVAAIIMPVSSLSVLVSTFIGTKTQRHLWK